MLVCGFSVRIWKGEKGFGSTGKGMTAGGDLEAEAGRGIGGAAPL